MYHPGIVASVLSHNGTEIIGTDGMQAMVEMWDKNVMTFDVSDKIKEEIKKGDIVLVDYSPMKGVAVPKHVIVKILRGEEGKAVWDKYSTYFDERNTAESAGRNQHTYYG